MIIWHGSQNQHHGITRYDLYYDYDPQILHVTHGPLCHTDHMFRTVLNYKDPISTWGFSAPSTNQMALALLGWSITDLNLIYGDTRVDGQGRKLMLRHHVAFAEEVLVNMKPTWTMTSKEILEWLNKKEAGLQKTLSKHKSKTQ